jgi:hypothetical protein
MIEMAAIDHAVAQRILDCFDRSGVVSSGRT